MKIAKFNLKKEMKRGIVYWTIFLPAYLAPEGKEKKLYFRLKAEAERKRAELIAATRTESRETVLSNAQTIDARRALERLAEAGLSMSLDRAVELALPLLRASGRHISVEALLEEFVTMKESEWRLKTARNFREVAKKFCLLHGQKAVADITPALLREWLLSFGRPAYAAGLIRTLRPAFSYAYRQGLIPESPFTKMEPIRVQKRQGVDIFTPQEARELMDAAPADCKAAFALLLFAGVRPLELTRLTWENIREGYIHITPAIAKTEQVRNIEIEPCLQAWLNSCVCGAPHESIIPTNWKRKSQDVRRAVGLGSRQDVARHSYATYHLAKYKDRAALEENMGHTCGSAMLMRHYRAATTPAEAEAYWAILPNG